MSNLTFKHQMNAGLHDIDAAGVMFFAHYFRHAHDAYEAFMAKIGFALAEMIDNRRMLPLVHSEADFLLPVHHGDRLSINLQLERIGTTSFTVRYTFLNQQGQDAARLQTSHVMLNPDDGKPRSLPDALRLALMRYAV